MTRKLVIRGAARADTEEAAEQYEARATDLGLRFTAAVRAALDRIVAQPESYGVAFRDVRAALVRRRFPFLVLYQVTPDEVVVIGVIPAKSNPAAWQDRT